MPNRIIKESICTSDEIDQLTPDQEVLFYRLMVVVDDFGLIDARLPILKSKCYPLKSIDINSIHENLASLVAVGLVNLYRAGGKPYLSITNWAKHQQIRAQRAKCPMPEDGSAITCNQLISDAPVIQSNPIQSESNPNPNPKSATATRLPADWKPSDEDIAFCNTTRPDLSPFEVADGFVDYWIAQPGAKGRKADWPATWRNWIRNQRQAPARASPGYESEKDRSRRETLEGLTGMRRNDTDNSTERDITGFAEIVG